MKVNRIIGVFLALIILTQTTVLAATDEQTYAANQLVDLGIMTGYSDGTLKLDNNITRAEVAAILVRALGYEKKYVVSEASTKFSDVGDNYWAYTYIQNASALGLITGYTDGSFRPGQNISYSEMIALMLRAYGAEVDPELSWPENYLSKAEELKLIKGDEADPTHIVTRGQVTEHLWKLLLLK